MKLHRLRMNRIVLLAIGFGFCLHFGQACSRPGGSSSESSTAAAGNGDYYPGKLSAISDSVSSYSDSTNNESSTMDSSPSSDPNSCAQLSAAICTPNSTKTVAYNGCVPQGSAALMFGWALLTYSAPMCTTPADSVVASTYDLLVVNALHFQLQITSNFQLDYRGEILGGGEQVKVLANGIAYSTKGKQVSLKGPGGNVLYSHTLHSLADTVITTQTDTKTVESGQTEVIDNVLKFTATYTADHLQYSKTCCHPVSGSMAVEFKDAIAGKGSVEFTGCGTAKLHAEGKAYDLTLRKCN
jgi:hypothetical protein